MTPGKIIKSERARKRLSQRDLEEMTGINHATISSWENDDNIPSLDKFTLVLGVLGLELKIVRKKEVE